MPFIRPISLLLLIAGLTSCVSHRSVANDARQAATLDTLPRLDVRPSAPHAPFTPWPTLDDSPATVTLKLEDLLNQAIQNNPMLRAEFARYQASREQIAQARSLPDPMLEFELMNVQRSADSRDLEVMLSQMFPWFGKLRLMGEMARAESDAMAAEYHTALLDVVREVSAAFARLEFEYAAWELGREEKHLLEQILQTLNTAYAAGKQGRQEILKTQTELARVENALVGFPASIHALMVDLNRLTGAPADRLMPPPTATAASRIDIPAAEWLALARAQRPELERLRHLMGKTDAQVRLARKDYFPDFTIGVEYGTNVDSGGMSDGESDWWNMTLGFNIPIPNARRRAQTRQAELENVELERRLDATDLDIATALRVTEINLINLMQQQTIFEDSLIPLAEETLEVSRQEYRAGKAAFIDLLDAERVRLNVRLEYLQLRRDYQLALAELGRTVGGVITLAENQARD